MQPIITAAEVIRLTQAGRTYPKDNIEKVLLIIQENVLLTTFGKPFTDYLLENLIAITQPEIFSDCKIYDIGDEVEYLELVYISKQNNNRCNTPGSSAAWELKKRFSVQCLEDLFTLYLSKLLAFKMYSNSLAPTTLQTGAGGVVVRSDRGVQNAETRVANQTEIKTYRSDIAETAALVYENMILWICQKTETCNKFSEITCINSRQFQRNNRRRIAIK